MHRNAIRKSMVMDMSNAVSRTQYSTLSQKTVRLYRQSLAIYGPRSMQCSIARQGFCRFSTGVRCWLWELSYHARRGYALPWAAIVGILAGCSLLPESVARDAYPKAPPSPSTPWRPPQPQEQVSALQEMQRLSVEVGQTNGTALLHAPHIDIVLELDKTYGLTDLIDLAQQANPETRLMWELTRAAAARLGVAESLYYPALALVSAAGLSRVEDRTTDGPLYTVGLSITPLLTLQWTLLDFGRRDAMVESAVQQLLQANFQFNRKHQEVTFAVQRSFYGFDASRAKVEATLVSFQAATAVQAEAEARMAAGLATQPDVLLARQQRARAAYEVGAARRSMEEARATLAESLGIPPTVPLRIATLSTLPLPATLAESVERVIDRALAQRPDLAARLATLRAREAEMRRARANFLPRLFIAGSVGGTAGGFDVQTTHRTFGYIEPLHSTMLNFSWDIFDGFSRRNAVREAEARQGEAAADLSALQLRTLREVWKAYADVKAALLQREYAEALLTASQDAYNAAFKGYQAGLSTILELLAAERDLAGARMTEIQIRADLLTAAAALAFAAAD
jgi:outer membrane protein